MAETPFVWGRGGRKLTPDQVERERESAALLAKGAMDYSPVAHWSQGLNRVAQGLLAGLDYRRADNADAEISSVNKGLIESLLGGGSSASSSAPVSSSTIPMTSAAGEVSATGPQSYRDAIASIESAGSGDYAAVGPTNDKLGRALGRYQIMEANIGPWSQEALGRAVTPDEFLADPALQDAIFDKKFGSYVEQFGPEGAAQAWFAGPGGVGKVDRQDVLGTNVGEYGSRFLNALGSSGGGSGPQAAIEAVAPMQPIPGESLSDEVAAYQQTPEYAAAFPGRAQPAQAAVSAAMPTQVAGGGDRAPMANSGINQAIVQALTNPQATPQTQRLAAILMEQEQRRSMAQEEQRLREADPVRQMQLEKGRLELESMRNPTPEFRQLSAEEIAARGLDPKKQYQISRDNKVAQIGDSGTNVTVNNGEGDKFYENLDKKNAEMFSALSEAGVSGRGKIAQINRLETILSNAPQGGIAALKQAAGEYGINTEGLSDIQAAQALINELVPQQRQPGSGPMSDADLALFKQSLPRIINQEGGNALIVQTMRGITDYQIKMGEIADAVADRSMNPTEGRAAIRNLANPLDAYTKTVRSLENDEQDAGWREISPGVRVRKLD